MKNGKRILDSPRELAKRSECRKGLVSWPDYGKEICSNIENIGQAVFAVTQLNWSSPGVAQRLPLHIKNSDDALQERGAQMVRGYR